MDPIVHDSEYARSLIEASLDPLVTINVDGKIMDVNEAMAKITGKEREELIGTDFKDYFTDPEKAHEVYQEVFAKGFVANYPLTIIDGVLTEVLFNGSVFKNKQGKILGAVVVARDITERRKSEIALQQSEARLKGIISSQTNYIIRTDLEGNYTYCNPKFINDFGWLYNNDNSELIGMSSMISIMPYHHEAVQHVVEKCFASPNKVFQIELDKPAKNNGIKTTIWDFILLTNQEGRPEEIQCAGINITDRKKEADEKEKIIKDLIQRDKNHEQFSYIISHNLRAPVANILGYVELLKNEKSDTALILDIVKGISVSAKKLDLVIRDLNEILNISTVISENKTEVHFQDLVDDISLSIENIIKKKNVIIQSNFKSVGNMLSIRSYLYSIFYNLILNSIKFHKPGVHPLIEIRSIRTSNGLQLIFKDNGMGIDLEKHQNNIFGLYKRFHLQVEGKGMGMFMVKTQVETLRGKISVSSEINKGSEFTIEFENSDL